MCQFSFIKYGALLKLGLFTTCGICVRNVCKFRAFRPIFIRICAHVIVVLLMKILHKYVISACMRINIICPTFEVPLFLVWYAFIGTHLSMIVCSYLVNLRLRHSLCAKKVVDRQKNCVSRGGHLKKKVFP